MLIPKLPCNLKLITNETAKVEKMIKKIQNISKMQCMVNLSKVRIEHKINH
jgi:hypothetical protein